MKLIFQYPIWFIIFCVLAGLVYAITLYLKSSDFSEDSSSFQIVKKLLFLLRFIGISILSFLLLSPLIKTKTIDKVAPLVILAQDNSSSIQYGFNKHDSLNYVNAIDDLKKKIEEKYVLDSYIFSDELNQDNKLTFKDKSTNISNALNKLNGNYFNRNVGAVILASDGIYNEGINPLYTNFNFPIYAIALGDTSRQKDLKISKISANKIAYLGDKVKVDIDIESYNLKNANYSLSLIKNNKVVDKRGLKLSKNYTEQRTSIILNANTVGIQKYTIKLTELKDEVTFQNNAFDFYIEVIDSRLKILLLAKAPHPDIAALKQTISENKNLDLSIDYVSSFNKNLSEYNLIILHHLPSINANADYVFKSIEKEKIPYFIITGSTTDFNKLNANQSIVKINQKSNNRNDVGSEFSENFNTFSISKKTISSFKRFPPLSVPFGDFKLSATANPLLFQKIGAIKTEFPVLCFSESFGVKSAIFIGEGLWRWKMYDYLDNNNHEAFNEVFQKTINYLALKADKRKFRVQSSKNMYFETEPVVIEAELYNESYELINEPDVSLTVKNDENELFPLVFSRANNSYILKTSSLPIGSYQFEASTEYSGKKYKAKGLFNIKAVQLEAMQTQANHKLLYQLAEKTGGKVFYPNELDQLEKIILSNNNMETVLYETYKTRSIIHLKWIFFLIIALLSMEWFLRKFYGAY